MTEDSSVQSTAPKPSYMRSMPGKMPIVIVSASLLVVAFLVSLIFGILLPNRHARQKLEEYYSLADKEIPKAEAQLEDLPLVREEVKNLLDVSVDIEKDFEGPPKLDELKKSFENGLTNLGFRLEDFQLGDSQAGKAHWWISYPVEFRVSGKEAKLNALMQHFFEKWPRNYGLLHMYLQKENGEISLYGKVAAQYLLSAELTDKELKRDLPPLTTPEYPKVGVIEGPGLKKMRQDVQTRYADLNRVQTLLEELLVLKRKKERILAVRSQDAFFATQRNMEFGQVFEQIEATLPKLGTKDRHEIFLKVDQEKIDTPKATEKSEETKGETTKPN